MPPRACRCARSHEVRRPVNSGNRRNARSGFPNWLATAAGPHAGEAEVLEIGNASCTRAGPPLLLRVAADRFSACWSRFAGSRREAVDFQDYSTARQSGDARQRATGSRRASAEANRHSLRQVGGHQPPLPRDDSCAATASAGPTSVRMNKYQKGCSASLRLCSGTTCSRRGGTCLDLHWEGSMQQLKKTLAASAGLGHDDDSPPGWAQTAPPGQHVRPGPTAPSRRRTRSRETTAQRQASRATVEVTASPHRERDPDPSSRRPDIERLADDIGRCPTFHRRSISRLPGPAAQASPAARRSQRPACRPTSPPRCSTAARCTPANTAASNSTTYPSELMSGVVVYRRPTRAASTGRRHDRICAPSPARRRQARLR